MEVIKYTCPKEFFDLVEEYLLANEVVNNLPLGILYNLVKNHQNLKVQPFLAAVTDNGQLELVMIKTGNNNLVVHGEGAKLKEAIICAMDYIVENKVPIPGVIGLRKVADNFAKLWSEKGLSPVNIDMEQLIYKLDKVSPIKYSEGNIRLAKDADIEILTHWIYEFMKEALNVDNKAHARSFVEISIKDSSFYIWEDEEPVSLAKKTRPTKNGIVINSVYTPKDKRGKGYASSCVASLSQLLLDEGYQFCSLYTDLSNPTSNKIYTEIGYVPIAESVVYKF